MQWVILAMTAVSAAASVLVLALVCGERRRSRGAAGANGEEGFGVCAAEAGAQNGTRAGDERAESAETLRARLAERRFSEGVMNVLNYENPAGKGNGA